jgi:hypothetical protein
MGGVSFPIAVGISLVLISNEGYAAFFYDFNPIPNFRQ